MIRNILARQHRQSKLYIKIFDILKTNILP